MRMGERVREERRGREREREGRGWGHPTNKCRCCDCMFQLKIIRLFILVVVYGTEAFTVDCNAIV